MIIRNRNTGETMDAAPIGQAGLGAYLAGDWDLVSGDLSDLTNDPNVLAGGVQGLIDSFQGSGGNLQVQNTATADDIGIDLKAPDGSTIHSQDYNDIQTKLSAGYKVINSMGAEVPTEEFQGGWLIAGVPINTVLTGTIDPSQYKALADAGKWNPENNTKVQLQYLENVGGSIGLTPENSPQVFEGLNSIRQQYGYTGPTAGSSAAPPPISGVSILPQAGLMDAPGDPDAGGDGTGAGGAGDSTGGSGAPGGSTGTGGAGQLAPFDATQYNNPRDLLNALLNRTARTGQTGSAAFDELLNGIFGTIGTDRATSGESYARQKQLYDMIVGRVNPALDTAMGQPGQDLSPNARFIQGNLYPSIQTAVAQGLQTGLSPEAKAIQDNLMPSIQAAVARGEQGLSPQAMAALQTQAMEAVPQNFNKIEQNLRSQLARRGAIGTQMPGSAGDIVREFGDLEAQKEGLRSSLMSNAALSDEQARQQNRSRAMDALQLGQSFVGLNEQATQGNRGNALQAIGLGNQQAGMLEQAFQQNQGTGLSAAQIANQLLGTGGAMFDPSAWLSSQNQLFGTAGGTIGGQNQSQMNAAQIMAGLGQSRVDLEPESLRNLLLSGLMGIGGSALSGWLQGRNATPGVNIDLGKILGTLGGLGQPGTAGGPSTTTPQWNWLG